MKVLLQHILYKVSLGKSILAPTVCKKNGLPNIIGQINLENKQAQ
jgi:hypothetical protein